MPSENVTAGLSRSNMTTRQSRVVGVIELGTTSIRMAMAQVEPGGGVQLLENLQQAVSLGRDSFTQGSIASDTIEECVRVLRAFKTVLQEHGVYDSEAIRVVATSAVREATNRDAFLDRILIATGLDVEVLDEADVNRLTYVAVRPYLKEAPRLERCEVAVVEVGGGSTEVLTFHDSKVLSARTYRFGSLRMRKALEEYHAPSAGQMDLMRREVDRTVQQIAHNLHGTRKARLLVLGGDARFVAAQLAPETQNRAPLGRVPVSAFSRLAESVLRLSVDDVVRTYHVSYPDAETLGPALLVYAGLASALKVPHVLVGAATLRDGLFLEMASLDAWGEDFRQQVVSSAIEIGRKYAFDERHALRVAEVSRELFRVLWDEHHLDSRYEVILALTALLHDIGWFVSNRNHHKHSMYLILNSDVFGLGNRDLVLAALVARYHRRALPRPTHEYYSALDRQGRVVVAKLAAILRVADAVCRDADGRKWRRPDVEVAAGSVLIRMEKQDVTLEEHALRQKGDLFERVYGMKVRMGVLGTGRADEGD